MAEDKLVMVENGVETTKRPIQFALRKPLDPVTGKERDQTGDAANHMRYAYTLHLPEVLRLPRPRTGNAIIVGGAPSIKDYIKDIKRLARSPENAVFALNFSHNWLIERGVVPYGCVLFEIDAEPDEFFAKAHPNVFYFICSHCHPKTFQQLEGANRVLWHPYPNSEAESQALDELFPGATQIGGGIGTFLRTMSVALCLGYRHFDVFGCDSSFPDDSPSTHVKGYPTTNSVKNDAFDIYVKSEITKQSRRFKSVGYLALQVEEFKMYCKHNHTHYSLRVHGDSLLRFVHENEYPDQYAQIRFGTRKL